MKKTSCCTRCGKKTEVSDYGMHLLCEKCEKWLIDIIKNAPSREPEVTIEKTNISSSRGIRARFDHKKTQIRLVLFDNTKTLCRDVSHEYMHYLLRKMESVKTSYQYDNISGCGELDEIL